MEVYVLRSVCVEGWYRGDVLDLCFQELNLSYKIFRSVSDKYSQVETIQEKK